MGERGELLRSEHMLLVWDRARKWEEPCSYDCDSFHYNKQKYTLDFLFSIMSLWDVNVCCIFYWLKSMKYFFVKSDIILIIYAWSGV